MIVDLKCFYKTNKINRFRVHIETLFLSVQDALFPNSCTYLLLLNRFRFESSL